MTFTANTKYVGCASYDEAPILRLKATLEEIVTGLDKVKSHLDPIKTDLSAQSTYDEINNFRKDKFTSFSNSI